MSKRVRLHCGNCSTTWANVVDTVRFYRFVSHYYSLSQSTEVRNGFRRITHIQSVRAAIEHASPYRDQAVQQRSLLLLLSNHRPTHASNPRDKYIDLVGLAKDAYREDPSEFYSKSVKQVYTFAVGSIASNEDTGPLNFLGFAGQPRVRKDLPSWVPGWSYTRGTRTPFLTGSCSPQRSLTEKSHLTILTVIAPFMASQALTLRTNTTVLPLAESRLMS